MELVLATHNLHKIREFREMLKGFKHIEVLSLLNFPEIQLPEETGKTFEENAILKAEYAASRLSMWVMADDSGLVVPAIQGRPGVFSQRYAGEEATDSGNRNKLLKEMATLQDLDRAAYFECSLAIAGPKGIKKTVTGKCEGYIAAAEKGNKGFGYDSLFLKHDYDKTFGELDEQTKNRISHRRKALDKLTPFLESLKA